MSMHARTGALVAALTVIAGCVIVASPDDACARDGWWGDLDKGKSVSLNDVLAAPDAHRARTLTFNAIFHRRDRMYDPLRSGFNAQGYDNFALWSDGSSLWERDAYLQSYAFFYLRKGNAQRDALMRIPQFTRLQVTARLRGSVRGKPAFEVLSFRPTGHRLGVRVVRTMIKGDIRAKEGDMRTAARAYSDVLSSHPDLPPVYALKVRKRLAEALREMGYEKKAAQVEGGSPIHGSTALPRARMDPFQPAADPFAPSFDDEPLGSSRKSVAGDTTGSPDGGGTAIPRGRGDATGSLGGDTTGSLGGDTSGSPDALPSWDDAGPMGPALPAAGGAAGAQPYHDGRAQPVRPGALPRRAGQPGGRGVQRPRTRLPGLGDPGARRAPRTPAPNAGRVPVRLPAGIPPKRTTRLAGVK